MSSFAGGSAGPSFQQAQPFNDPNFDIFDWHTHHQSCVRYFLDHAQYSSPVQAVASFVNIRLPYQQLPHPVVSSKSTPSSPAAAAAAAAAVSPSASGRPGGGFPHALGIPPGASAAGPAAAAVPGAQTVSLIPYIRRLVATGFDYPGVLHGFFGDDWVAGIGRLHEAERRNYLFAAKSQPWLSVKDSYDMDGGQYIPFLRPLLEPTEKEFRAADASWSEWLSTAEQEWKEWMAMEDWVLGPRAPREFPGAGRGGGAGGSSSGGSSRRGGHARMAEPNIKMEQDD